MKAPVSYRGAARLLNAVSVAVLVGYVGLLLWWSASALPDSDKAVARFVVGALPYLAASATALYWPTRRRPTRLYHLTSNEAADAATVARHDDGTITVQLRALRHGRPVYLFPRPPRRLSVLWNVRHEPEVCIELFHLDYRGVAVRRRLSGAYALRGLVQAQARIHPINASE